MEDKKERADRFNTDKPKWALVDFKSLEPMVNVLEFGAQKYSKDNWKKGLLVTEICESLLRHTFDLLEGKTLDDESKLKLTGHILANAMILEHMISNKPEFDDRVK